MARTEFPRVKVTTRVAARFANLQLRNKTYDGNYIIWMTDINNVPGDTLADRVKYVGGAILTPTEAKAERNGTAEEYAQVFTPVYLDKDADVSEQSADDAAKAEVGGNSGQDTDASASEGQEDAEAPDTTPVTPSVTGDSNQGGGDDAENADTEDTAHDDE